MDDKQLLLKKSIAQHYFHDARDFAARFDVLWETQTHKTGRIKSFVDLLMSAECVLKAHIFLGNEHELPSDTYKKIRKAGHRIGALADEANYLLDRRPYDAVKSQLNNFPVFIRYSLNAYETLFPSIFDRDETSVKYSATIGNNPWVLGVRQTVGILIDSTSSMFTGFIDLSIEAILEDEQQMRGFMAASSK